MKMETRQLAGAVDIQSLSAAAAEQCHHQSPDGSCEQQLKIELNKKKTEGQKQEPNSCYVVSVPPEIDESMLVWIGTDSNRKDATACNTSTDQWLPTPNNALTLSDHRLRPRDPNAAAQSTLNAAEHITTEEFETSVPWTSKGKDENRTKDSSKAQCRICFGVGKIGHPLLSVCRCRGSVGLVHRSCIEDWINSSKKVSCELCGELFCTETVHSGSVCQWIKDPSVKWAEIFFPLLLLVPLLPGICILIMLAKFMLEKEELLLTVMAICGIIIPLIVPLTGFAVVVLIWLLSCHQPRTQYKLWKNRQPLKKVIRVTSATTKTRMASSHQRPVPADSSAVYNLLCRNTSPTDDGLVNSHGRKVKSGVRSSPPAKMKKSAHTSVIFQQNPTKIEIPIRKF